MLTSDRSHLDYAKLLREGKRESPAACRRTERLAILSDAAVPQLVPLLKALLARHGVRGEIYLAEFDSIELEVFNPESGLYQFAPDTVVILNSLNALRSKYHREADARGDFSERIAARTASVWDAFRNRSTAAIVQNTYVLPYERHFGNFDHKVSEAFYPTVQRLNLAITALARDRAHVLINDVDALASYVGRRNWLDERLWTLAKAFCALEHLPLVAQNIVDIVLAKAGQLVKCVVVDLDNTLWGGVIGDDGLEGIVIGPYGDGEPFHRLQHYLLELKRRGIVLAVCSKNEQATAVEPFRHHPEMVLREEDFAVFVANWNPKPDNIRHIQQTLNIGLDSIAFLDDNIFERQLVRETLPEVIVPELPEDPADYVRVISELNLFETTSFSDEDRRRADLYRQNASRQEIQAGFSDLAEYLRSLDMQVTLKRFDTFHLPRIAQLIQRSNQFNLTTRRYSQAECEAMMIQEGEVLPLYVKLADKFGDNGLISVVILRIRPPVVEIDSWLMSCRVLGRGVEQYVMNQVMGIAARQGCTVVEGCYIPSAKNAMVKDFYRQFGFERVQAEETGVTRWRLAVSAYQPCEVQMTEAA
ncbi:MAG TPA: HAD-IIIC family phosphatase [Candidatus Binatia bacterium]|nr:HAD-IIIC family phosphatase [Candidatus Binatia bacterium]